MADPGPDVPKYSFMEGVETLREIPNVLAGMRGSDGVSEAESNDAIAIKIPSEDKNETTIDVEISYKQLHDLVEATATALVDVAGITPGDIVSIPMPNNMEFILSFLAVPWARATAAPLNPDYTETEYAFYMEDNKSKCVLVPASGGGIPAAEAAACSLGIPVYAVVWDSLRWDAVKIVKKEKGTLADDQNGDKEYSEKKVKRTFAPEPEDVALFLHTSGTTARPKVNTNITQT
jgi:acyl-CoA synthetase (AMP-forming)/AMP-acid ligase II